MSAARFLFVTLWVCTLSAASMVDIVLNNAKADLSNLRTKAEKDACYRQAYHRLGDVCPSDDYLKRQELAFHLMNCQLRLDGLPGVYCSGMVSFCPKELSEHHYQLLTSVRLSLDSTCHFLSQEVQIAMLRESANILHTGVQKIDSTISLLGQAAQEVNVRIELAFANSERMIVHQTELANKHFLELAHNSDIIRINQETTAQVADGLAAELSDISSRTRSEFEENAKIIKGMSDNATKFSELTQSQYQANRNRAEEMLGLMDRISYLVSSIHGVTLYFNVLAFYCATSGLVYFLACFLPSTSGRSVGLFLQLSGVTFDLYVLKLSSGDAALRSFIGSSSLLSMIVHSDHMDPDAFPEFISRVFCIVITMGSMAWVVHGWFAQESQNMALVKTIVRLTVCELGGYVSGQQQKNPTKPKEPSGRSRSPSASRSARKLRS